MTQLSRWIQGQRQYHLLTQDKLAELMDVDVRTIRRWESGKSVPQYDSLSALCLVFKISTDELWFVLSLPPTEGNKLSDIYADINTWSVRYWESKHTETS